MKIYLLIIAAVVGMCIGTGSTLAITNAVKPVLSCPACPPAPPCNCPPATEVNLANFDVEKFNNKKGAFTYAPSLNNVTVRLDCKDSVLIKQLIKK